uniref:Uncharacterized protein n=1 Tax=Heterorhabditis bacteriophora TaxID=37862 RepID=A0A1I7WAT7_HETBA
MLEYSRNFLSIIVILTRPQIIPFNNSFRRYKSNKKVKKKKLNTQFISHNSFLLNSFPYIQYISKKIISSIKYFKKIRQIDSIDGKIWWKTDASSTFCLLDRRSAPEPMRRRPSTS